MSPAVRSTRPSARRTKARLSCPASPACLFDVGEGKEIIGDGSQARLLSVRSPSHGRRSREAVHSENVYSFPAIPLARTATNLNEGNAPLARTASVLAAKAIGGTILGPGDVFSYNTGRRRAPCRRAAIRRLHAYSGVQDHHDEFGGGVYQPSSARMWPAAARGSGRSSSDAITRSTRFPPRARQGANTWTAAVSDFGFANNACPIRMLRADQTDGQIDRGHYRHQRRATRRSQHVPRCQKPTSPETVERRGSARLQQEKRKVETSGISGFSTRTL
ncbi:MAG: hypothetical protein ACLR4Z_06525 [Butyricicoccaceae bacterium]